MARPTPTMGRHIGAADGGGQPHGPRVLCWRAHSPMRTPQPLPWRSEAKPHWWCVGEIARVLRYLGVMPRPPAPALEVSPEQRDELLRMSRSTSRPHRVVVQAKALLLAADRLANAEIARR